MVKNTGRITPAGKVEKRFRQVSGDVTVSEGLAVTSVESITNPVAVTGISSPISLTGLDAFGRLRVSNPVTLFDSKQTQDKQPLLWDDQEVSGASTTSSYSADRASTTIGVAATTAGKRVRSTRQRFNYQPGKSMLVLVTGVIDASGGGTGIIRRWGYFDEKNGIFFKDDEGVLKIVRRSYVSGSAVDTEVTQTSWNGDTLDGNGASGITLSLAAGNIYWTDFEWLGVGKVQVGIVSPQGEFIVAHTFENANALTSVYMSTPNLPVRFEIENDATGALSTLETICATVIAEGGEERRGVLRYASTDGVHVDADAANTIYAVIGFRLKSTALDAAVEIVDISMISETNDDFEWMLIFNPTVAGTFTYSDETNSAVQTAKGATANTVTPGTKTAGGFAKQSAPLSNEIDNALRLGSLIDGTPDEIVLCVRPLSANADIQGGIMWREVG